MTVSLEKRIPMSGFGNKSKCRSAMSNVTLVLALLSGSAMATAQENNLTGDLPHALFCGKAGFTVVGYLTRVNADGSAVYMTPTGIVMEVSADGIAGGRSEGNCSGKSMSELRANSQTRDFAK